MHRFAGFLHPEEGGVWLQIPAVELPDKTRLGWVAHPGNDSRDRTEKLNKTSLVHGAERFIIHQLGLAHKISKIERFAVTPSQLARIGVAVLSTLGEIMLGPIVVDRFPILARHHGLYGLERGHGDTTDLRLEGGVGSIELLRLSPSVRPPGLNPSPVG